MAWALQKVLDNSGCLHAYGLVQQSSPLVQVCITVVLQLGSSKAD